jgi:hypothetical protein
MMSMALVLFAIAVGFVSAGILAATWTLAFDEEPAFAALLNPEPTLLMPFRALAIVFSAPSILGERAIWWLIAQPLVGIPLFALAAAWSFVQGVVILTQFFGFK